MDEVRICKSCQHPIKPGEKHWTWVEANATRARSEARALSAWDNNRRRRGAIGQAIRSMLARVLHVNFKRVTQA